MYRTTLLSTLLLLAPCVGCSGLGPKAIRLERTPYNLAIQETQDTQLLLNLVRLRYRDTPVFLELSGITSQISFESGAEGGAEIQKGPNLWKLGLNAKYTTAPTVTYTPLQGEKFTQQLLAPLKIETVMLLYRSGWPLKRVLRLCVQKLNQVEGAVRASGPTPETAPRFESFARVLDLIGQLNDRSKLDIVYETPGVAGQSDRIALQISKDAFDLPETQELRQLLGLDSNQKHYPLTPPLVEHADDRKLDHLEVETRSLLGALFFLSQSVEPPESDIRAGKVTVTRTESGGAFDWKDITRQLLQIHCSPQKPVDPAASVWYRGNWFYIDDADLSSKSTMSLLSQLLALQSAEIQKVVPVLTIPVR